MLGNGVQTFSSGKFDQLESTGYSGPSHVPGSQTAAITSWYDKNGKIQWPPNGGAVAGSEQMTTLKPGDRIARYGQVNRNSNYVTKTGANSKALALPPTTDSSYYYEYEIIKTIPNVRQSTVAEWPMGTNTGGGLQYELPMPIVELLSKGYIKVIT